MSDLIDNIISSLKSGPMSAAELARRLRVDATTVSRRLNALGSGVIKAGEGRSTRWYLRRQLPMTSDITMLPVYRVDAHGKATQISRLHIVHPTNSYLEEYFRKDETSGEQKSEWHFYESLPWWLTDMRAQGFLGRSFAQQLRAQGQPLDSDPNRWTEDTALAVLAMFPQDQIGNLLVGDGAYERWLQTNPNPTMTDNEAGKRAEAIARGEHFDSSAKGEQPKFTARLPEGNCIVKFSGQVTQLDIDSAANRWADLLHAESLAAKALNAIVPNIAAPSRSFVVNGRTLLACERFDRTPEGGRRGVISWTSLDLEFVGQASEPWPVIADALYHKGIIIEAAVVNCKVAWAFGQLIANSDMHLGNVSSINQSGRPYVLSPIYDMLPMHYSPKSNGDLPTEPYTIRLHRSVPRICWESAYSAANVFWRSVLESSVISQHFKELAEQQFKVVDEFAETIRNMD
ncbi:type II toxin-antitoxin system HipA family toxin YjjJ [Pseudidiomarina sp. 1ASP75-14]|uniref:type II toxin-antitoxin system HipA family toxin YjjJ n=1 Tax=Pseudidiomarina terrestris TaxID=2820060 RepID=UPI00264B3C9F|nr:type II toxin-antitoxin system HipA family toxin YjjJ [Pseudidiomarina sp. 1ASP75-14]MDN7138079.1 type II toxin-antitoxin system HipA family toxin YjjJ [Pseudidiomarina sp. 1ASP75-14]